MSLKTRAVALGIAALSLSAPVAQAADHADGTVATADPSTDIGDMYAWMDSGAANLNMVMTVFPSADKATSKFSTTNLYVFHVMSKASISDTGVYPEVTVVCSFDAAQTAQCWAGDSEYVTGNANTPTGLVSKSGKFRVFAGPRNDPFFFNLNAFNNMVTLVKPMLAGTKDAAGCLTSLTVAQQTAIRNSLSTPVNDYFVGRNVLAIVVQLDKGMVTTSQRQTITVYGSTNKPVP